MCQKDVPSGCYRMRELLKELTQYPHSGQEQQSNKMFDLFYARKIDKQIVSQQETQCSTRVFILNGHTSAQ